MTVAKPYFLMVLGVDIDTPEIVLFAVHEISDRQHGCQHGMVLIIVPMQSIPADGLKVFHRGQRSPGDTVRVETL